MKLAGTVTLYRPEQTVLDNIMSYAHDIEVLYVIDNTENPEAVLAESLKKIPNVRYVANGENMGVARALNLALREANTYDWLLTMDQDSRFEDNAIQHYQAEAEKYLALGHKVAMFSVNWSCQPDDSDAKEPYKLMQQDITSGSLLNIRAALSLGGFDEALFIDAVDNEFCWRAQRQGYQIVRLNSVIMAHQLGSSRRHHFLWKHPWVMHHGALRKYYMFRNCVYVFKRYPEVRSYLLKEHMKVFILMLMFEEQRWRKLKAVIHGIRDGLMEHMGKYSH